jgi:hypothetical protein
VTETDLSAITDPDARENYRVWLRFRDRLAGAATLEQAYVGLFAGAGVDVPPLFVHQLTQILLRHVLGDEADPFEARCAEMLFRSQKISVLDDGAVMAADERSIELYATTAGFGSLGELLKKSQTPAHVDLDVQSQENAPGTNRRTFRSSTRRANRSPRLPRGALTAHFLSVVSISRRRNRDARWVWRVGTGGGVVLK